MVGRYRAQRIEAVANRNGFVRVAIAVALTILVLAMLSVARAQASTNDAALADRAGVATSAKWEVASSSGAIALQSERTAGSPEFANCCGASDHHLADASCAAGTCSTCCVAAIGADSAPMPLADSSDYRLAEVGDVRSGIALFLFRPPRLIF